MRTRADWRPFGLKEEDFTKVNGLKIVNLKLTGGGKPGSGLVNAATVLLFLLAIGLFAVSLSAQYSCVFAVKHQSAASMIEAVALDMGMAIFSLLALGLARAGKSAKVERALVLACAAGSAAMNYAASDVSSPRSALAYLAPPLFLAVVVDRVVAVVRRHVLGDDEGSPWSVFGRAALYLVRFVLAPPSTAKGLRRWLLISAPLPTATAPEVTAAPAAPAIEAHVPDGTVHRPFARQATTNGTSKTGTFLTLVTDTYGPLADLPLERVSRICTELAPKVELDCGAARTALRKAVIATQNGSAS
jgi:hypothetical protein